MVTLTQREGEGGADPTSCCTAAADGHRGNGTMKPIDYFQSQSPIELWTAGKNQKKLKVLTLDLLSTQVELKKPVADTIVS